MAGVSAEGDSRVAKRPNGLTPSGIMDESAFERARLRARVVTAWLAGEPSSLIAVQVGVPRRTFTRIVSSTPGLVEERAR